MDMFNSPPLLGSLGGHGQSRNSTDLSSNSGPSSEELNNYTVVDLGGSEPSTRISKAE